MSQALISAVEHLKSQRIIKKDADIVEKTGVSKSALSNYLSGRVAPSKPFQEKFSEVFKIDLSKFTTNINSALGVPVYDMEFSAGVATSILEAREVAPVIARLSLPEVIGCDAIIRARGNSMSDLIDDRDWIGIKMITDWDVLLWDYPYAVVTDELEVIKYIKKSSSPKNILLVSHNKSYTDVELPKAKIRQLFLVKVVLPFSKVKTIV